MGNELSNFIFKSIIVVVFLLGISHISKFVYRNYFQGSPSLFVESIENQNNKAILNEPSMASNELSKIPQNSLPDLKSPDPLQAILETNFIKQISAMGKCLSLSQLDNFQISSQSNLSPTLTNLVENIKQDLGDSILQTEDQKNTTIELSTGEKRLISLYTEFQSDGQLAKRLAYYKLDNRLHDYVPIDLPEEETVEPQDSYISKLEQEGKIVETQVAKRIYFKNGEELSVLEKNNLISNAEMDRNGKSFRCTNLDTKSGQCECL